MGISYTTFWKWRQKKWINPINICGRLYIAQKDSENFEARAANGDFAKEWRTTLPRRKKNDEEKEAA